MNKTRLHAIVGVFALGFLLLSAAGQAQSKDVSLQAELLKDWTALKALDNSFDYGAAILKQQTDQSLLQSVPSAPKFMGPSSRAGLIAFLAGHTWDIYGQMAVYLRLNGHVPPASQRM